VTADAARAQRRADQPDRTSLKESVLGMMIELARPMTPQQIKAELQERSTTAMITTHYVHYALKDLLQQGFVEEAGLVLDRDSRGRAKRSRTYVVTEPGAAYMQGLLRSAIPNPGFRDEALVRIMFWPEEELDVLAEHVKAQERRAHDELYALKSSTGEQTIAQSGSWSARRLEIVRGVEVRHWQAEVLTWQRVLQQIQEENTED
jgi:DNA-binding PadR family transcriptional regulator